MDASKQTDTIIEILEENKASDITKIDVQHLTSTVDFMVQRVVHPLHYTIESIERAKGKEKCNVIRINNLMGYQLPTCGPLILNTQVNTRR